MAENLPCEVCGAPAALLVQDLVEGEPSLCPDGRRWRTWLPDGCHLLCEAHRRRPALTYRHGTPTDIAAAETDRLWCESLIPAIALSPHLSPEGPGLGVPSEG